MTFYFRILLLKIPIAVKNLKGHFILRLINLNNVKQLYEVSAVKLRETITIYLPK